MKWFYENFLNKPLLKMIFSIKLIMVNKREWDTYSAVKDLKDVLRIQPNI